MSRFKIRIGILNKKCSICKTVLPLEAFPFSKKGILAYCKSCFKNYKKKEWLRKAYNLTIQDYQQKLVLQKFKCGICRKHQKSLNQALVVDHNHMTKKVRGLLCVSCNINLGVIEKHDFVNQCNKYLKYWHNH